jgi:hypothetical protein
MLREEHRGAPRYSGIIGLGMLASLLILAATYIVPSDAEMVQKSDAIVIATCIATHSDDRDTHVTLRVDETLNGEPGPTLELTEKGGRRRIIAGAPHYEPGARYLVFAQDTATFDMALGQFRIDGDRVVRSDVSGFDTNLEPYTERPRDAARFVQYVRDTVAGRGAPADYFVAGASRISTNETLRFNRTSYLLQDAGFGYRWPSPVAAFVHSGTQPGGDGQAAITKAFAQWDGTDSAIDYTDGGVDATATGGLNDSDGKSAILFNDPNNEIPDGSSIAGIGGAFGGESVFELDGETFFTITEGDVVISNRAFSQTCLDTIVAHETGHTLGLRHANEAPPGTECNVTAQCTSLAVMNASVICSYGGVLQEWDKDAAAMVYGDGTDCRAPEITEPPASGVAFPGAQVFLSVEATGSDPMHYQWFADDTPVGFDTSHLFLPGGLNRSTTFTVTVSNDCGSETSNGALIVVLNGKRRATRH